VRPLGPARRGPARRRAVRRGRAARAAARAGSARAAGRCPPALRGPGRTAKPQYSGGGRERPEVDRRSAARAPGRRQSGRQRAAPWRWRDRAPIPSREHGRGARGVRQWPRVRARDRRPGIRALRPRRPRPHARRHRPGHGHRAGGRGGSRRPRGDRGGGRRGHRADLAARRIEGSGESQLALLRWDPSSRPNQGGTEMKNNRIKRSVLAVVAVAALGAGGAAIATAASGGGGDEGSGKGISGAALDRASSAALSETGGGKVTATEVGDEESYYEVEVTRSDGSQVDVQLDRDFQVVGSEGDNDKSEDEK